MSSRNVNLGSKTHLITKKVWVYIYVYRTRLHGWKSRGFKVKGRGSMLKESSLKGGGFESDVRLKILSAPI